MQTHETSITIAQIARTNADFMAAIAAGDAGRAVADAYTTTARILPPGSPMLVGRTAITAYWHAVITQLGVTGVTLESMDLRPVGDQVVEVGRATLTVNRGAQQLTGKYMVLWRQEDGRWRWDVDCWNLDG